MLSVYGVAPSEVVSAGSVLVQFPPLSGRTVGGVIPVDCQVSVLNLSNSALGTTADWPWKPVERGYVVTTRDVQSSLLKNHLRQIRHVQDASGSTRIWPWFDPHYLRIALKTLQGQELAQLFGPIESFGFACESGVEIFQLRSGSVHVYQVYP